MCSSDLKHLVASHLRTASAGYGIRQTERTTARVSVAVIAALSRMSGGWSDVATTRLLSSGAFYRLRDSQHCGEIIVTRLLVNWFLLFDCECRFVPVALRLREAVIAPRTRVLRIRPHELFFVSAGRGWRLGFVSLERVSSPP